MKRLLYGFLLLPSLLWADTKVSGLTEDLTGNSTNYIYEVISPGGTGLSRKIQIGSILNLAGNATTYLSISSATVSYLGKSSSTITELTKSSASVSYLGISSGTTGNPLSTWSASTITATTVLVVPNGLNPQVDVTGRFAIDTSSGQIIAYNGSDTVVLTSTRCVGLLNLETPTAGDFPPGYKTFSDQRITSLVCVSTAATSATISFLDCAGSDGTSCNTLWSSAVCGTTEFSVGLSSTVIQGRRVRAKVTEVSGTPGWVGADVCYSEIRQ